MSDKLAAAEAALKAGQTEAAIGHLVSAIDENPARPAGAYRVLCAQLYRAGRDEEGLRYAELGAKRFPKDAEILNLQGVFLRRLRRFPEALKAFELAGKADPRQEHPQVNRGNVLIDMGMGAPAEAVFTKLVRTAPRNAELQRMLGRALRLQGKLEPALAKFRQALTLDPRNVSGWIDLAGTYTDAVRYPEAEEAIDKGLAATPRDPRLLEAKVQVMRKSGRSAAAEALLRELAAQAPDAAWIEHQLGMMICDRDRDQGNVHLRRAVELDPGSMPMRMSLIESLERTRSGDEGANIEEAYQLLKPLLAARTNFSAGQLKIAFEVLIRVCAFEELEQLGSLESIGRAWAASGRHTALLKLLAHVKTPEDRAELLEQHRLWGQAVEAVAAKNPLNRPPARPAGGKIRLGLLSSDLRLHPVGYFAAPLFEHLDPRFELYCYSFFRGEQVDTLQEYFTAQATAYRWNPDISDRDAAQMIADDQLDFLIELGGSTYMNKLEVMAWKPAPRQASWLGYPHSAGLETIDYLITDPHTTPARPELLIEQPLVMPASWIALGRQIFNDRHLIEPGLPEERAGRITFGTANNPHKYNPEMIELWSRVLNATPGSRFVFIRPEGGTSSFRSNLQKAFAAHGIGPERIEFRTIRGAHMPFYNEIDITLDTLPLTGGTTTTEALWMGVPVVSLVGEAFYERLSASILANSGAADLATSDRERYVQIAVDLAADRDRRLDLRQNLRDRMKAGPLGRTQEFARDFYDLIARTVQAG
jgi:predicted O-linked N-acetylglucosamine transferase (SPINDLY family)